MVKRTQRKKKKYWNQIKSNPMESNEIGRNHWNHWRPNIDIDLDLDVEIDY